MTAPVLPTLVPALQRGYVPSDVVPSIPFEHMNKTISVVLRLVSAVVRLVTTQNCMVDSVPIFLLERMCSLLPGSSLLFRERDVSNYVSTFLIHHGVIFLVYLYFEHFCTCKCSTELHGGYSVEFFAGVSAEFTVGVSVPTSTVFESILSRTRCK